MKVYFIDYDEEIIDYVDVPKHHTNDDDLLDIYEIEEWFTSRKDAKLVLNDYIYESAKGVKALEHVKVCRERAKVVREIKT